MVWGRMRRLFPSMFLHYLADALGEVERRRVGSFRALAQPHRRRDVWTRRRFQRNPVHLREYDLAIMAERIRPARGGRPILHERFSGVSQKAGRP